MFCRTRCMSNPFAVDRTIISFFDVESQIFVTVATRASISVATEGEPALDLILRFAQTANPMRSVNTQWGEEGGVGDEYGKD